ncbi:hypothetical protein JW756_04110 [Candidatus Woesearchaeota archaeon]|nr:hypothetical protein [Candidatus Woesearchaeota archaeon]
MKSSHSRQSYKQVCNVCAKHKLKLVDYSAIHLLNNWHNDGENLENIISKLQAEAETYQLPFTVELDSLGFNEAMLRLAFDKKHSRELLAFYNDIVIPESQKKQNPLEKIRSWMYELFVYHSKTKY